MPNLLAAPTQTGRNGLSILDRILDRLNDARMLDRTLDTDFYAWLGTVSATGTLCRLSVWLAVHPRSEPNPAYVLDGVARADALPRSNSQTDGPHPSQLPIEPEHDAFTCLSCFDEFPAPLKLCPTCAEPTCADCQPKHDREHLTYCIPKGGPQ